MDPPFGQQLYDELKRLGRGHVITQQMNYAEVQKLKAADREQAVKLFHGSSYELLQRLRRDEPAELAAWFDEQYVAMQQAGAVAAIVFAGATLLGR